MAQEKMVQFLKEVAIRQYFGQECIPKLRGAVNGFISYVAQHNAASSKYNQYKQGKLVPLFTELWVSESLGGKHVGKGSAPIDVFSEDLSLGIDVKCLGMKNDKETNACTLISKRRNKKSIHQVYSTKINNIKQRYGVDETMYAFLIHSDTYIGLAVATVSVSDTTKARRKKKVATSTTHVRGIIDESEGKAWVEESGKCMNLKLRLHPKNIPVIKLWSAHDALGNWRFTVGQNIKNIKKRRIEDSPKPDAIECY
jgi:DNA polymerase III alpha subunit